MPLTAQCAWWCWMILVYKMDQLAAHKPTVARWPNEKKHIASRNWRGDIAITFRCPLKNNQFSKTLPIFYANIQCFFCFFLFFFWSKQNVGRGHKIFCRFISFYSYIGPSWPSWLHVLLCHCLDIVYACDFRAIDWYVQHNLERSVN